MSLVSDYYCILGTMIGVGLITLLIIIDVIKQKKDNANSQTEKA